MLGSRHSNYRALNYAEEERTHRSISDVFKYCRAYDCRKIVAISRRLKNLAFADLLRRAGPSGGPARCQRPPHRPALGCRRPTHRRTACRRRRGASPLRHLWRADPVDQRHRRGDGVRVRRPGPHAGHRASGHPQDLLLRQQHRPTRVQQPVGRHQLRLRRGRPQGAGGQRPRHHPATCWTAAATSSPRSTTSTATSAARPTTPKAT